MIRAETRWTSAGTWSEASGPAGGLTASTGSAIDTPGRSHQPYGGSNAGATAYMFPRSVVFHYRLCGPWLTIGDHHPRATSYHFKMYLPVSVLEILVVLYSFVHFITFPIRYLCFILKQSAWFIFLYSIVGMIKAGVTNCGAPNKFNFRGPLYFA